MDLTMKSRIVRLMHKGYPAKILFLALAAARPAGAQVLGCDPFPTVAWWGSLSHESVNNYVVRRHRGDWGSYIKKWETQSGRLKQVLVKGSKVVIKSQGITLKGQSLRDYITKMEKRVAVIKCLATKVGFRTGGAELLNDDAISLREWKRLAEEGDAAYQFMVGALYEKGRGVPKDYPTAVMWFRKAADQGNANAQYNLGKMYEYGLGVAKDYASVFSWIKKSAEGGVDKAQYNMGKYLRDGLGVKKDPAEGLLWWTKAAEQGYAKAQGALGFRYEQGRDVPKDYAKAVKWYRRAAEQGNAQAKYRLGLMYERGQGVSVDPAEAARLYREAAEQGLDIAIKALGRVE